MTAWPSWRSCCTASTPLLLASAAPQSGPPALPSVIEAGRTAATLSDWQTIAFFLMFLLVVSTVERLATAWQMRTTLRQLTDAMDRLAEATQSRATDIKVQLALIQSQLVHPS